MPENDAEPWLQENERTLMYSIGQTAVASIPPATQPALMANKGFFFLVDILAKSQLQGY